jgi:hypothetical protein
MSATNTTPARRPAPGNAIDDIDAYIASLPDDERGELALAAVASDLAAWLDRVKEDRGRREGETDEAAALRQQAASHVGLAGTMSQLGALQRYLNELGYELALRFSDIETGEPVGHLPLPPAAADNGAGSAGRSTRA